MYAVMRTYSGKGAKELFDALEKNKPELEKTLRSIKGFVGYTLARNNNGEGGFSLTSCQDKSGAEESMKVARDWIAENTNNVAVSPPKTTEGSIILHLS